MNVTKQNLDTVQSPRKRASMRCQERIKFALEMVEFEMTNLDLTNEFMERVVICEAIERKWALVLHIQGDRELPVSLQSQVTEDRRRVYEILSDHYFDRGSMFDDALDSGCDRSLNELKIH